MITLYDYELSSACYQVRLYAAILGVPLERRPIDIYPGHEHRTVEFHALNPLRELPVIDDDGWLLHEPSAILVYLASRYDASHRWYDLADPAGLGRIGRWLAFAARMAATAGKARLHDTLFAPANIDECRSGAHALLRVLDEHLWFAEQEDDLWICSREHPTIADIACFPDIMLCEEGGISRMAYPAILRWTDRVKRIPNFTLMPGIFHADAFVLPEGPSQNSPTTRP